MRIFSWNVNGLRACTRKGFLDWLHASRADLVCVQEVRARPEQLAPEVAAPPGWHASFVMAEKPGYSGVGFFSRVSPQRVVTTLGAEEFDREGRLQLLYFSDLLVANVYFPNGSGKHRDNSRIPYKLDFYRTLFNRLEEERRKKRRILVVGDFNTAHQEIDLARPKQNHSTSGFCPEERDEITRWLDHGWVDTFRSFEQGPGHYTWWSNRQGARERNVGWRIDYMLACPRAMKKVQDSLICPEVSGSDHCPIGVITDDKLK